MWYDLVVLAILVYATVRGAAKGIVWQLAVIAALVLCFAFSETLSLAIAPLIQVQPPLNRWIAMFVLYVGFSFLSFAAARGLKQGIEKAKFEEYDRHLGALFGFAKGVLFALFVTFFGVTLSASLREQVMHSYSGYAAALMMDRLHPVMPEGLSKVLEPYIHQLDRPEMDLHHAHDPDHPGHDHVQDPNRPADDVWNRTPDTLGSRPVRPAAPRRDEPVWSPDRPTADPLAGGTAGRNWLDRQLEGLLPQTLDPQLRDLALQALRNTAPEDRDELLRKISSGVPGAIRQISVEWQEGKPAARPAAPGPPVPTADHRAQREQLLGEIAAVHADSPAARQRFVDEQLQLLTGLPTQIELAVLQDWHSDLLSFDPHADPEPATDYRTDLPTRIVRHLDRARVPLSSLSSSLQTRLRGVQTR